MVWIEGVPECLRCATRSDHDSFSGALQGQPGRTQHTANAQTGRQSNTSQAAPRVVTPQGGCQAASTSRHTTATRVAQATRRKRYRTMAGPELPKDIARSSPQPFKGMWPAPSRDGPLCEASDSALTK